MLTCPHCYSDVIPRSDHSCPACLEDTRAKPSVKRELTIYEHEPLPAICHECAVETERYATVRVDNGERPDRRELATIFVFIAAALMSLVFAGIMLLIRRRERSEVRRMLEVRVRLPQCEACAERSGSPKPRHIDFEGNKITFIVHKKFRSRVLKARQERLGGSLPDWR